ncbi:MAG: hypothetical protein Q8O89_08320 [Nanoarchaeota archaeon]|nr:hypothetical protein [Nanoarchaeota archaeon]
MGERTRKIVSSVFLLTLFLVAAIYTGLAIVRIYTQSSSYSTETSKNSLDCVGYIYSVEAIKYENGLLSFTLRNAAHSDKENINLIIKSGNITKEIEIRNIYVDTTKRIDVAIDIKNNTFETYAKNCENDALKHAI